MAAQSPLALALDADADGHVLADDTYRGKHSALECKYASDAPAAVRAVE